MLILGIDEAARGSVVGSLFIAGALFEEKDLSKLKKLGVKDSKLLSNSKRFKLCGQIAKIAIKTKVIEIPPYEIDDAVERKGGLNLNWLESQKTIEIINHLKPEKVIIDCPSPNIAKYTSYIKSHLEDKNIELVVEHKADLHHIECSAASILAKCAREEQVEKIKKFTKLDIGSGYISDPKTVKFLEDYQEFYADLFRKSWQPFKKQKQKKSQKSLEEF